ncbi:uncharacterized protein K460DRAFT_321001 [Cucurbitaria berberidis CBS 394.84]|uniref:UBA domain-containing protein n=1 Tax=Cucurbitaria berberidis CBS 394.84 TaxID=1168544 RepID=A0A9P4G7W0_9PLEO|nr:uncharacterized protein K460DRAFT_321001 [Cucurbitaria berberidis CBS 394.84]KAF1840673.1 hypothetical protein K460DRAFT_321001 [Cucurbitaria berberidis CBS 394.84]
MRVIQDSDDDLDDDLEADMPAAKQPGAPEQQTSQSGTGSTESLKRAIEQAHRAHLQSQPSQNEPQSSVSLPEHPSKRRKTAANANPRKSPDFISPKGNGSITYSKRSKSVFSASTEPVHDHLPKDATAEMSPFNPAIWSLEGTMRDNYVTHDPMMLFPEPSSTVPNATLTQQRVLEGVTAPAMLGDSGAETSPYQLPPEPSVPWSDMMKFSPTNTSEEFDLINQEPTPSNITTAARLETPRQTHQSSVSQRSRRGSSVRLRGSQLRNTIQRDEINPEEVMAPHWEATSVQRSEIWTASSESHRNIQQEARNSSRPRKSEVILMSNSDDDLAAVGLPEEQYKPRPSRSRSLRAGIEQPIEDSVRPELAKRVSKRRKTTAVTSDASVITTPQKIQQICDMGFTPSTTERALEQNSGDVTQTVDWLVNNGISDDELAPHNTPKKKLVSKVNHKTPSVDQDTIHVIMRGLNEYRRPDPDGRQETVKSTLPTSDIIPEQPANDDINASKTDEPSKALQTKSPKVQVVIPKQGRKPDDAQTHGLGQTPSKKPKRRKTTLDQPEAEPLVEERAVPQATSEKKRGRGRPKKVANTALSADTIIELPGKSIGREEHAEVPPSVESNPVPPPTISAEIQLVVEPNGAQGSEPENQKKAPIAKSPPKTTPATAASQTPERSTELVSHSPNNKGKVPHRVGLSKRARITPLLRILKK